MKRFLLALTLLFALTGFGSAEGAILVQSTNGKYTTKTTLAIAATAADTVGKTIVVTSPQVVTTAIVWPADRALEFKKGGYVTFTGAGALTGLKEARPEWFGSVVGTSQAVATTNTIAYKAAIASLDNATGTPATRGILRVPLGISYINDELNIPRGISVIGAGEYYGSQIVTTDNSKNILLINGNSRIADILVASSVPSGATNSGIKVVGGNDIIDNVFIQGCYIGLEMYQNLWTHCNRVQASSNNIGLKLHGDALASSYTNNCTFSSCRFNANVTGALLTGAASNVFTSCNFEANTGMGLVIDFTGVAVLNYWSTVNHLLGDNSFIGCWFEQNGSSCIYIRASNSDSFINCNFYHTGVGSYVIDIDTAKEITFTGGTIGKAATANMGINLGALTVDCNISIPNTEVVTNLGTNNQLQKTLHLPTQVSRLTLNQTFNVAGAGTPDTLGSWNEDGGGTVVISQDSTDLIRPATFSQYSAKIEQGAAPTATQYGAGVYQTRSGFPVSTKYHVVVEYKHDLLPSTKLVVKLKDLTNNVWWSPTTQTWVAADTTTLILPTSVTPRSISIPFVSNNTGTHSIVLFVFQALQAGASYHLYSAAIQPNPVPNPAPTWTAAPTANTWAVGDRVVNTTPTVGQPKSWVCTVAGTPGTWVSEGNL